MYKSVVECSREWLGGGVGSGVHTSDRNDIRGNVGGDITTLSLNDGKGSKGTTTELVVHLGRTLEKTRVEVEDVTGVSLTTGRAPQQQTHLAVGDSLLGQVIVDDKSMLAVVTEPGVECVSGNSRMQSKAK